MQNAESDGSLGEPSRLSLSVQLNFMDGFVENSCELAVHELASSVQKRCRIHPLVAQLGPQRIQSLVDCNSRAPLIGNKLLVGTQGRDVSGHGLCLLEKDLHQVVEIALHSSHSWEKRK